MTADTTRRLWVITGWLLVGYVVLSFAGVAFQSALLLGDSPDKAAAALVRSSMAKNFAGGYLELLATLVFLVGMLGLARLLRRDDAVGEWLSSCIAGAAIGQAAVTVAVGFAAGAAAIYDGHHGAPLATVTTVNDIRNFAFFLSGGFTGVVALAVAAAVLRTATLPRWVGYAGAVIGVLYIAAIPAARTGVINAVTLVGFVWIVAIGVTAVRRGGRERVATVGAVPAST